MSQLALLGYGRMGREIERIAVQRGHEVTLKVSAGSAFERIDLKRCDVAIDFSSPQAAAALCHTALQAGCPVVSGTTGWDVAALLTHLADDDHPAFLHATNMSPGVNAVFAANRLLARVLGSAGGYRAALSETHHVHKLDAPSGTAITLAEGTLAGLPGLDRWAPAGEAGEAEDVLPVASHREGEVYGDHEVTYRSEVDEIVLSHRALSRAGFALGAVLAAEFVSGKRGVYTMADVLGLGEGGAASRSPYLAWVKTALKILAAFAAGALLYVVAVLARGTFADWQPSGIDAVTTYDRAGLPDTIRDSVLSLVTWNVGYGGLGAEADFFLDAGHFFTSGGSMVHSPPDHVERYTRGILQQFGSMRTQFALLQEVDSSSARSHHRPMLDELRGVRVAEHLAFAPNFINERVPVPLAEPWGVYGDVYSGLATFSDYRPLSAERHALPGEHPWPNRLFQLDRCVLLTRFALADGRTLTVINAHLSAYDDGSIRAQQLAYLEQLVFAEHDAGHLVIVGGDWNLAPPRFPYDRFIGDPERDFVQGNVPPEYPTRAGWTFVYDARTPTNRKLPAPYIRDSTFVTLIDYFLISPGLRAVNARGIDQDFQFSDHQPVYAEIKILPVDYREIDRGLPGR